MWLWRENQAPRIMEKILVIHVGLLTKTVCPLCEGLAVISLLTIVIVGIGKYVDSLEWSWGSSVPVRIP